MSRKVIKIGTRTSKLALWQTNFIAERIADAWPQTEFKQIPFLTKGDRTLSKPLPEIGGKGLFTAELEQALRQGEIDLAVHSLKDLPVIDASGLTIGAVPPRADVADALVAREGWTLESLPRNARVGTSSLRRKALLLAARPDLNVQPIRGNVDTRVKKVFSGRFDAIVLAAAGLDRLQLSEHITERLRVEVMLPAPGQGALAVQCRADDEQMLSMLTAIEDAATRRAVIAERQFLWALGGGCSAPIAAYAVEDDQHMIQLRGLVADLDGVDVVHASGRGEDPAELGQRLAAEAKVRGATRILSALDVNSESPDMPLAGRRIVVTRAREQASSIVARLTDLGATPILFPAIEIAPHPNMARLDSAIRELASYDWILFTSVNGVSIFWQQLSAAGMGAAALSSSKVAAIGPATSQALESKSVQITFSPDEYVAESLAEGLGNVAGQRILLPRAELARPTLVDLLTAKGAFVNNLPIYQTKPAKPEPAVVAELEAGFDAITFTSSSTVRFCVRSLRAHCGDSAADALLEKATVACIGPITAATARDLGLMPAVIADEYTIPGLIQALINHYADQDSSQLSATSTISTPTEGQVILS